MIQKTQRIAPKERDPLTARGYLRTLGTATVPLEHDAAMGSVRPHRPDPRRYPHEPIVTALERDLPIAAGECRLAGQSRDQADDEDTGDK